MINKELSVDNCNTYIYDIQLCIIMNIILLSCYMINLNYIISLLVIKVQPLTHRLDIVYGGIMSHFGVFSC